MAVPPVIEITSSPTVPAKAPNSSRKPVPDHVIRFYSQYTDNGPDRLPTVSASQAFQDLQGDGASCLPIGLSSLDSRLSDSSSNGSGGIERGKVTEIWGPTGAGKTGLA